jgi:iron complex transport system substrate-binding protein
MSATCFIKHVWRHWAVIWIVSAVAAPGLQGAPLRVERDDTIIDHAGRHVRAGQPFLRIISLYGAHTENLFALEADDHIIGVERNASYPEKAKRKMVFSYHDDPEKFLAHRPDLVLIRPMIDRGYPRLVQRLEKQQITVLSLQPNTIDEMYLYWEILGLLTGRKEAAAQMISVFKATAAETRSRVADMVPKKRVYFEAIHSKMKTFAPDAMAIFALETAGGINIASDAAAVRGTNIAYYGKERILAKGARIDVYLAQWGTMNRPTVAMIKNEPGYDIIKAVRRNQINIIDEQIVSRPTLRLLDGIHTIGTMLYPHVFTSRRQP